MPPRISALMDGELSAEELEEVLNAIPLQHDLCTEWRMYHLISDALKIPDDLSIDMVERVMESLPDEGFTPSLND